MSETDRNAVSAGGRMSRTGNIRLPFLIAIVVVSSMSLLAATLIWQGWSVGRTAIFLSSERSILDMGRIIDEKAQRILAPSSVALSYLVHDPLVEATTLDDRLSRVGVLARTLDDIPFLSSVYVGYADGAFILLRPFRSDEARRLFDAPADADYLAQIITRAKGSPPSGEWRFYGRNLEPLQTLAKPDYSFDPRPRPWFSAATTESGEHLTSPYVFFTTNQVGVTLSRKAVGTAAVVGLDVELAEFGAALESLRMSERSEIAIIGPDSQAVAYTDMSRIFSREGEDLRLKPISELGAPILTRLANEYQPADRAIPLEVGKETWLGLKIPLPALHKADVTMLVAVPSSDLLAPIYDGLANQLWWAAWLMLFLLVLGWTCGRKLGQGLTDLARRAQRLSRFDFQQSTSLTSPITEVRELERVIDDVCATVQRFLTTMETIGQQTHTDEMLQNVLRHTVETTGCELGVVYLMDDGKDAFHLVAKVCAPGVEERYDTLSQTLPLAAGRPEYRAQQSPGQLMLPLSDRRDGMLGLLLLRHPANASYDGEEFRAFAAKLSGGLSSSIAMRSQIEAQRVLLDGFVQLIADAIDAKSPYMGNHCRRVPKLATMIVDQLIQETTGPYGEFKLTTEQRQAFQLATWLHDCGKLTSPEHIIDKATKLETIHNRIHEIRMRFEVIWRDCEIAHLNRCIDGVEVTSSRAALRAEQRELIEEFTFVAGCNVGTELMTDGALARLRRIAGRTWLRHFDNRLGLSRDEEKRLTDIKPRRLPIKEPLLSDRPEHILFWQGGRPPVQKGDPANKYGFDMDLPPNAYNIGELHNLSIARGTLTEEERFKINEHVVQTYIMLRRLSWPKHLWRVPEIASTHHERMDGKGYPRRILASTLSVEERVICLADVFEALTAGDRPYKKAKTVSEALHIMVGMATDGHLDPMLMGYFLEKRLWLNYASDFLVEQQLDHVDTDALRNALPLSSFEQTNPTD